MSRSTKRQAKVPQLGDEGELFGARLREVRIERGLTQPEVANRVGTSASNISDLERGIKVPTLTTVARLAAALECNVSELIEVLDRRPRGPTKAT
ncbi:MAG: helix-turn-helix transcriptional regulator [Acidobacteria bacterium]|nr:helix-turn-helix transcriptional regulator [Acidobacteriota bacterium]MBV9070729.1 helix-turn-helix transcriptional regulator [Acidobacteriota bacterium]MBV9188703.1 helix-turn-helix transcriptional regulator [Acidobacteriota bacterium]